MNPLPLPDIPTIPQGPLDLLVKAALAPADTAIAAWVQWRRNYGIDKTPWNEVRLLGAVSNRIGWLEPDADILPRIRGIQRFLYAQSQVCLVGSISGLKDLAAAGIPLLFMKGAARIAADDGAARERLVRDIDVLVPLPRVDEALDVLTGNGWDLPGQWQQAWRNISSISSHHAWTLLRGKTELDLHLFSNYLNRLIGDDDGLWARSRVCRWRGIDVNVPCATDNLILAIVHGLRWSQECNADWVIDGVTALRSGEIDWPLLLGEARRRRVAALLLAGLFYIREAVEAPVPPEVLTQLSDMMGERQRLELLDYACSAVSTTVSKNDLALAMALERSDAAGESKHSSSGVRIALDNVRLDRWQVVSVSRILQHRPTRLVVEFDAPVEPGVSLMGAIFILGLMFDCKLAESVQRSGAPPRCRLAFDIHPDLLIRRGVTKLVLRVIVAGSAPELPWVLG